VDVPACAHRCETVQARVLQIVRLTGQDPAVVRLAGGMTREYVPPVPPRAAAPATARCAACGHLYGGPGAVTTARECADLDTGTTDQD